MTTSSDAFFDQPGDHRPPVMKAYMSIDVTFEVDCQNASKTLPDYLKGYRPGERFIPSSQPSTDTPPAKDEDKPKE